MAGLSAAIVLALTLQAAGREGTVTGTLVLNGVPVTIEHVYASAQPGFFDKKSEDIHLLFSDAPLADADRDDTFAMMHLARDGKARVLEVVIDKNGQPISGAIYAREFDGMVSVTGMHQFTRERLDRTEIAGRMQVPSPHEFMKVTFQYDLHFSAPIPRPPTAAETAAALSSPPAKAATAYIAAIRKGDLRAVEAAMTADAGAAFKGSQAASNLKDLRDDMPADTAVVSLEPQTDGSVLAKVEGHRQADGMVIGYTFRLVMAGGVWKIDK